MVRLMKTALVGIIRNEASDLLAWIGWHALLGVDTFVLFDDGSDDGTRALLKAASVQHDIRVFFINELHGTSWKPQQPVYWERQRIVYMDALHALKESVDWVGFLDTDEYLALHRHDTLKNFLRSFGPDVGAVGIHWCLYGSSGHITRPDMPPFYAYTRHSTEDNPVNRHIKTFLRPQCWNGEWENAYAFPLKEGRYVDPDGRDLSWGAQVGMTEALPDWATARIMHFRVRSLEHFVERARRRRDSRLILADFNEDDCNDSQDSRHQGRTPLVLDWMRQTVFQGVGEALNNLPLPASRPEQISVARPQPPYNLAVSRLIPWNNDKLEIHGSRVCSQGLAKNNTGLFVLHTASLPHQGFLFALDLKDNILDFSILADSRLTGFLGYNLVPTERADHVALQQIGGMSRRHAYLTTVPGEPLIADRPVPHLWETFSLAPAYAAPDGRSWNELSFIRLLENTLRHPVTLGTIAHMAHKDRLATIRLLPLLHSVLSEDDQKYLAAQLGPFAPFVL